MKRSHKIALALAILALLGGLGYWVYSNLEWEETTIPVPVKGPARANNLLAAERLAARLGSTAESAFGIQGALQLLGGAMAGKRPDPANTVLILPTERRTFIPRHDEALRDWVNAGGHLIGSKGARAW